MKVVLIVLVSAALALGVTSASAHEQRPKLGDSCPVLGASVVIAGETYTCVAGTQSKANNVWGEDNQESSKRNHEVFTSPVLDAAPASQQACKLAGQTLSIANRDESHLLGAGFSKTTGTFLTPVVMLDSSDNPADESTQAYWEKHMPFITEIFSQQSYGKLNYVFQPSANWYRMSKPSSYYRENVMEPREFAREALAMADRDIDFSQADHIHFLRFDGEVFDSGRASFVGGLAFTLNNNVLDGKTLNNAGLSNADRATLIHETTHQLGLVDLYSYDSMASNYTGIWSYMADSTSRVGEPASPGLFAWERWYLNWIDDNQITCMSGDSLTETVTALDDTGGIKAVVVPIGPTKAVVVESRRAFGIDSAMNKEGALVYVVDTSIAGGAGPIRIVPKYNWDDLMVSAPRALGESVTVEGVKVTVTESFYDADTVTIHRGAAINTPVTVDLHALLLKGEGSSYRAWARTNFANSFAQSGHPGVESVVKFWTGNAALTYMDKTSKKLCKSFYKANGNQWVPRDSGISDKKLNLVKTNVFAQQKRVVDQLISDGVPKKYLGTHAAAHLFAMWTGVQVSCRAYDTIFSERVGNSVNKRIKKYIARNA